MTKMQQLSKHMPAWVRAAAPEGAMEDTLTPQTLLLRESAGARYLPGMDMGMTCEASGASHMSPKSKVLFSSHKCQDHVISVSSWVSSPDLVTQVPPNRTENRKMFSYMWSDGLLRVCAHL